MPSGLLLKSAASLVSLFLFVYFLTCPGSFDEANRSFLSRHPDVDSIDKKGRAILAQQQLVILFLPTFNVFPTGPVEVLRQQQASTCGHLRVACSQVTPSDSQILRRDRKCNADLRRGQSCTQLTAENFFRFATYTQRVFADDRRWHADFPAVPHNENALAAVPRLIISRHTPSWIWV